MQKSSPRTKAEYLKPREILMHTPDDEVFYGVLDDKLYEKAFHTSNAREEHISYIEKLRATGAIVHTVRDVLLQKSDLRDIAKTYLKLMSGKKEKAVERKLDSLSDEDLVKILLLRPAITRRNNGNSRYQPSPLTNLYFTRDQMIVTDRGVVVGSMRFSERAHETSIIEVALDELGIEPIYKIKQKENKKQAVLEGGDFFPMENFALIGVGYRTNMHAVNQLLENDVFGFDEVAVVNDRYKKQDEMHLDTYFNVIGKNKVMVLEDRLNKSRFPIKIPKVTIYENQRGSYTKAKENLTLEDYLKIKGFEIVPVTKKMQMRYGCNFLCIGENEVIVVDNIGPGYLRRLELYDVNYSLINFRNLTGGYGGPHCTTQVLIRE